MLQITVDGTSLWLEPDTKLRYELNSTIFDREAIPGSIIYPFDIPISKNQQVFNYAHFVEINSKVRIYDCVVSAGGFTLIKGKLLVSKINYMYYRCSVVDNAFSENFQKQKLNELSYSDITIGGTPHSATNVAFHAEQVVKGNVDADYTFPVIFAEYFYGDLDEDTGEAEFNPDWGGDDGAGAVGKYINNYNASGGNFFYNSIHEDPLCDNVYSMVPFPYLHALLEKLFNDENYQLTGDFMDDTELAKLIIGNNYPLDAKEKKYYVRVSMLSDQEVTSEEVVEFNDESSGDNEDDDNAFTTATHKYEIQGIGYHQIKASFNYRNEGTEAQVRTSWSLKRDGVEVDGDTITGVTGQSGTIIIDFTEFIEIGEVGEEYWITVFFEEYDAVGSAWGTCNGEVSNGELIISNNSQSDLNIFSNTLNIANHLPEITVSELVNAIRLCFGLAFYFDHSGKVTQIDFLKDLVAGNKYLDLTNNLIEKTFELELKETETYRFLLNYHLDVVDYSNYEYLGAYDTYDDLPTPNAVNKVALVVNSNVIYIYKKNADTNELEWTFLSDNIYPLGSGDTDIDPDVTTLPMHIGNDLLTAQTKLTASSPAFETGINDFPFILLFDRGMQEDDNGDDYPMAGLVAYDLAGTLIANYEFKFDGNLGLYAKFLSDWYDFLDDCETYRCMLDCNIKDMMDIMELFRPQKGVRKRKIRINNVNYIPQKITFILGMKEIEQAEAILVKGGNLAL
jgi:hypothetical protein